MPADTYTWTGAISSVWQLAGNWTPSGSGTQYPGSNAADNAVFSNTFGNFPVTPITLNNITTNEATQFSAAPGSGIENITINGTLTIPGGGSSFFDVQGVNWGAASTLHFTGADFGILNANDNNIGPHTINASADLVLAAGWDQSSLDLSGSTVNCAGSCEVVPDITGSGTPVIIEGTTFIGQGIPGKFFTALGASGTPASVTGFEPLYKVGAAGSVQSARGSTIPILVPGPGDVKSGVSYGPDNNQQTGTLDAGGAATNGGRMGIGI